MKQYKLCTIHEFAEYVAEIIDAQGKYENGQFNAPLPDYDFAIADKDREGKTLEEISLSSGGWYGMKQFDAGFDSIDLCLITDYYGGGSATITQIYGEQDKENTAKDIEDMIISSFNICEIVDKETVLIIEFEEVNGMTTELTPEEIEKMKIDLCDKQALSENSRKEGEWLYARDKDFLHVEVCSVCNYVEIYNVDPILPFCPNCGSCNRSPYDRKKAVTTTD